MTDETRVIFARFKLDIPEDVADSMWPMESSIGNWENMELFLDQLRKLQGDIIESLGRPWPACPVHSRHPLTPTAYGWQCPTEPDRVWTYGSIRWLPEPERIPMEDGEIMWVQEDQGWAVIASQDGDVWFHATTLGPSFNRLKEGDGVRFRLKSHRPAQGKFLAADMVWLEPSKS